MQRILAPGQAEQTLNKSRFIAVADYCLDERAVAACLRKLATAHATAHHLAYAFRLKVTDGAGRSSIVQRFHDAGEPSGTAGKPILQFIEGRDLINVCVGVIRYYGGINLGTGGLARAYGSTAKMAIDAATLGLYVDMQKIRVTLDYKSLDNFTRELGKVKGEILDKQFGEYIEITASLPASDAENFQQRYARR